MTPSWTTWASATQTNLATRASVRPVAEQWHAETVVDEEQARALVRGQFPTIAARSVQLVGSGWDYTVFRVDDDWAFRFPRRRVVLEPMARELAVLPGLAPLLPLAVPVPVHLGRPGDGFPWPFYGASWLSGGDAVLFENRDLLAPQLGRFLRALHAAHVPGLPSDANRRADMSRRVPLTREALAAIAAQWTAPPQVEDVLRDAEALPPSKLVTVCHGDLHVRQLLVEGPRLAGIIDWVDVCCSDPGIDLMVVFAFLPPAARPAFFAEYGEADAASLLRARVLALNISAVLARYARAERNDPVEREALASLDRAVAGL